MAEIDRAMQQPQAKLANIQQKIQWQGNFIRALVDGLRGDPHGLFEQQLGAFDAASERPNIARILTDMKETAAPCVWAALSEDLQTYDAVRDGEWRLGTGRRRRSGSRGVAREVMMGMRRDGLPPVVTRSGTARPRPRRRAWSCCASSA